jgi:alkyl sulfatase BDS1-like metallo-beta-lactamase superfamily hydrolase
MIYGTQNLEEQERNAWQRGDYPLAEALQLAIDADEDQERASELQCIVDDIRDEITAANWRTGKKTELRELVEKIVAKLAGE